MRFVKELRGGSLSKTVLMSSGKSQWVRKYISIEQNREYGLVRWQSQLRKLQVLRERFPGYVLPILGAGVDKDYYYFDIPYVTNSHNLYEAILHGQSSEIIAKQLAQIVKMMVNHSFEASKGSLSVYLHEELKRPLQQAQSELENVPSFLSRAECNYFKSELDDMLPKLDQIISAYRNYSVIESLTHGNFTLENAIWDYDSNQIFIIDVYAETYCETILGDISQIYQSSRSGYEAVSEYFETSQCPITQYPYEKIPKKLTEFSQFFEGLICNEYWYDQQLINLFLASQFTRMFPFKLVNNPRGGFLFINHAMDLMRTK